MAKLTNPTKRDITLPAGHIIPRDGDLITTNDVIYGDNWPVLQGLILSKTITCELDADPVSAPIAAAKGKTAL